MTNYFTSASEWLGKVAAEFLEDKQRFGSMDYNFRMIDYSKGYGTKERSCKSIFFRISGSCLPHRDFGLLTLIQQNGVSGLQVEMEDRMIPVPGDRSILLAGWCLHLVTNGQVPAPLHQVIHPEARRLSCVTFMAPPKVSICQVFSVQFCDHNISKDLLLRPMNEVGPRVYRDVTVKELKMMMAKRWRHREGTLILENGDQDNSQDDIIFKVLTLWT